MKKSRNQSLLRKTMQRNALVLGTFLAFVFLVGGGSRGDIQSLIILRPVAMIVCALAAVRLGWPDRRVDRLLLYWAFAWIGLALLHLIPLPPALWHALPGRELLVQADRISGLGDVWRPLSMDPEAGWNAFYSLFVPLGALLLGLKCSPQELQRILPVVIVISLLSAVIGLLQVTSGEGSPLYFYRIHNAGMVVGLFANRNHTALLFAATFPMLATYAATAKTEIQWKQRTWGGVIAAALLVPLILVNGSRAGLALSVLGVASAVWLWRRPAALRRHRVIEKFGVRWILVGVLGAILAGVTLLLSRAVAVERLLSQDTIADIRGKVWQVTLGAIGDFFPFGSGIGTFVRAYQIHEPDEMIRSSYVNHVHNDYLEIAMSGGLPAILLALAALAFIALRGWQAIRGQVRSPADIHAKLGFVLIVMMLLGSIVDYPLRVPSLACLFVVAILWLRDDRVSSADDAAGAARSGMTSRTR